jgi:hypothetical protein
MENDHETGKGFHEYQKVRRLTYFHFHTQNSQNQQLTLRYCAKSPGKFLGKEKRPFPKILLPLK